MDPVATCCCGVEVSAMVGTCDACSLAGCSFGWCSQAEAPAVGA